MVSSTNHNPFKIKMENEYSLCEGQDFYGRSSANKVDRGLLNKHGENEQVNFSGISFDFRSRFFQNGGNGISKSRYQIPLPREMNDSSGTSLYTECSFTLPLDYQKQSSVNLQGKPRKGDLYQSKKYCDFISNKKNLAILEAVDINHMGNIDSSGGPYKETRTKVSSLPPTIQQYKCEQPKNSSIKNSNVLNQLANSVPIMGEPEQHVHSQVLFSQDEIISDIDLDFPKVSKPVEDFKNKHSKENIPAEVERTPCATVSRKNSTISSNIARRLYEHKRKR